VTQLHFVPSSHPRRSTGQNGAAGAFGAFAATSSRILRSDSNAQAAQLEALTMEKIDGALRE
jgi:hypothetical protein